MHNLVLGAGMTGLAVGLASNSHIYEAKSTAGGICSSYYLNPYSSKSSINNKNENSYRFEIGGGHWIFGGDLILNSFLNALVQLKFYDRLSSVYFPENKNYVPYPIQNHLAYLDKNIAERVIFEIINPGRNVSDTMEEWLVSSFGKTLSDLFFIPFHELYTAGYHKQIAPQDAYKSPVNINQVLTGAFRKTEAVGYNTTFSYPQQGLDYLSKQMAKNCNIHYKHKVVEIDTNKKIVTFENGKSENYERLISTLPLNLALELTGLTIEEVNDPYSSVLVLNIGAKKGKNCPKDHWLYIPESKSNFHRVGFYSNVDHSFVPNSSNEHASLYIERAFKAGEKPTHEQIEVYKKNVEKELQEWGYINDVEVNDPTWIEVAYTWSLPKSNWVPKALEALKQNDIYQIGRYGRWTFQGIAASIKEGFIAGNALKYY